MSLQTRMRNAAQQRHALLQAYRLEDRGSLILCAMPPDQRPAERPASEFRSYPELLEFWVRSLGALRDSTVLINLHPRLPYEEYKYLEQWGVTLIPGDVAQLIPLCDLYVASVSATIPLALACGKPVINYDVYGFAYDDFRDIPQVLTVDRKAAFLDAIARFTGPGVSRPDLQSNPEWGLLDGNAGSRLIQLFQELLSPQPSPDKQRYLSDQRAGRYVGKGG